MNWRNFESSGHRFNRKAKCKKFFRNLPNYCLCAPAIVSQKCDCDSPLNIIQRTRQSALLQKPDVSLPLSLKLCMQIIEYCWAQTSCSSFCFCRGEKFLFSCLPNNGLVIYNVFIFTKTSHFWWIWEFRSSSYLIRCCYRALLESLTTLA